MMYYAATAMAQEGKQCKVCVTGGAGFIGSWLVKMLLNGGYTVHATLLNIDDEEKAVLLRRLVPGAAPPERLVLFEADLNDPATFAPAIAGCRFVFLVATPTHEALGSEVNMAEVAVGAARAILRQCAESKTVKRVIHTASMSAASPLKEETASGAAAGYMDFITESCWTPFNVDYPLRSADFDKYIESKLLSEKELLSYNDGVSPAFEVGTLACGVVAGDTVLGCLTATLEAAVSPVAGHEPYFGFMRMVQRLLGSVPLVHVDDVCRALVFCMEADRPSLSGRFLCAAAYPTIHDVVDHYATKYPHLDLLKEADEEVVRVQPERNKLGELGFMYKYGMEEILDGSVNSAVRLGGLPRRVQTNQRAAEMTGVLASEPAQSESLLW